MALRRLTCRAGREPGSLMKRLVWRCCGGGCWDLPPCREEEFRPPRECAGWLLLLLLRPPPLLRSRSRDRLRDRARCCCWGCWGCCCCTATGAGAGAGAGVGAAGGAADGPFSRSILVIHAGLLLIPRPLPPPCRIILFGVAEMCVV